jgi:hypothetical protein
MNRKLVHVMSMAAILMSSSCAASSKDLSEKEFLEKISLSKENSSWKFVLENQDEKYYYVTISSSPFHTESYRIPHERLKIECVDGAPPCVIKEEKVVWQLP